MKLLSDKIADIAFWICIPTVQLTEGSPNYWIRLLGVLLAFPLFFLQVIGLPILLVALVLSVVEEI